MSENPAADDAPDLTPPTPPEAPQGKWMPLGIAAVAVMLLGIAVLVWQPWTRYGSSCSEDASHVIDEKARLCYELPEGWSAMDEAEREAAVEHTDGEPPSSGATAGEDQFALVEVHPLDRYLGAYLSTNEPVRDDEERRIWAELVTVSSAAMLEADHSIDSRNLTIGDFDAATATAEAPFSWSQDEEMVLWVRATVVDFGEEQSAMWSMTIVPAAEVEDEGGEIALLNQLHDSIDVR